MRQCPLDLFGAFLPQARQGQTEFKRAQRLRRARHAVLGCLKVCVNQQFFGQWRHSGTERGRSSILLGDLLAEKLKPRGGTSLSATHYASRSLNVYVRDAHLISVNTPSRSLTEAWTHSASFEYSFPAAVLMPPVYVVTRPTRHALDDKRAADHTRSPTLAYIEGKVATAGVLAADPHPAINLCPKCTDLQGAPPLRRKQVEDRTLLERCSPHAQNTTVSNRRAHVQTSPASKGFSGVPRACARVFSSLKTEAHQNAKAISSRVTIGMDLAANS